MPQMPSPQSLTLGPSEEEAGPKMVDQKNGDTSDRKKLVMWEEFLGGRCSVPCGTCRI